MASSRWSAGGAREQKAGDIHAREQQHGENGEQQHPGGLTAVAALPIADGADADMDFLAIGRRRPRDRLVATRAGARRHACAGVQPGRRRAKVRSVASLIGKTGAASSCCSREQDIEPAEGRHDEILGKNADDLGGNVLERDGKAEHVGCAAVARSPKVVREQSDARGVGAIFVSA